jgi:hypothetical protein
VTVVVPTVPVLLFGLFMRARKQGATALAAGAMCWGVNVLLTLTVGMYGPILVIFGALGVFAGAALLIWGDSFRTMSASQKIPAALIALAVTLAPAFLLLRWTQVLVHR